MRLYSSLFLIVWIFSNNFTLSAQGIHYKTQAELANEKLEKLKIINHSVAFSLHYGYFQLFPFVKTDDNTNNIDISNYHSMFNLSFEYYPYENAAVQLSAGLISIHKEQTIDSIKFTSGGIQANGSGKGGAILPVTLGIKKTFFKGLARPYVSLLAGFTYIKIGTGTGSGSINGVEKNVDYQSEFKFCYQLESGVQIRTGKIVRFDSGINFYGGPNISPSIGGINSFSGWYLFGGMNFILNSNKKKKHR